MAKDNKAKDKAKEGDKGKVPPAAKTILPVKNTL